MTEIAVVPAAPVVPPFPALGAPDFNQAAYDWGTALPGVSDTVQAIAVTAHTNATVAGEQAESAVVTAGQSADSAGEALGSKNAAAISAGEALASKNAAALSADAADASRIAASKLNLGSKASPPTVDNQGAALAAGATYYDTALDKWRVWTGTAWGDGISAIAGVSSINGMTGDVVLPPPADMPEVPQPVNTAPADAATGVFETPALTGSAYYSLYSAPQAALQVQVSVSPSFAVTMYDSGSLPASTSHVMPAGLLSVSSTYYWRLRYQSALGAWSEWSVPTSFVTASEFVSFIPTPAATPAIGAAFEGGFYTGMIWNELVQSASSTTIGTGTKTFAVPSMAGAPIVYAGQQLEVRSRANPANKMIGTVTNAVGTALTINVSSVGGSGTFADWSIMSRYRVIVAPKASGENASIAYKNAATAAPAATGTLTEGRKATLAMVGADTSTVYPAAHWCNNLNIGGKTDWYLPARDELELCWRNLKPTTTANYTIADRSAVATPDYQNLGSYGGAEATHGLNKNSAPAGAKYGASDPGQTSVAAFQTGGAEAYEFGAVYYGSSSEQSGTSAWIQRWGTNLPGYQDSGTKTSSNYVRAVRRSII